mgnify:CR=1 FL=1
MNNELIIIISVILIGFAWIWYQDKKKKKQELSDRLHNAENNITHLSNQEYMKRYIKYTGRKK